MMIRRFVLPLLLAACSLQLAGQMLVCSYNIRYKNDGDSTRGDVWTRRCQVLCDQVNFMSPDVMGTQEVLYSQLQDMHRLLDGYDYIGVGRDDGRRAGEYAAIFYKPASLRLLDQGNFWLSDTPDRPGLGWDAACVRICTWARFARQNATDDESFYFFNLHMDHVGVIARRESAKLVVAKIKEIAQDSPVIVTGDFNVDQTDETYGIITSAGLLQDSYEAARVRFAENGTFNSFDPELFTSSRIDHVFVSACIEVDAYGVLTNGYWSIPNQDTAPVLKGRDAPREISFKQQGRRLPSDHYPVFVRLRL